MRIITICRIYVYSKPGYYFVVNMVVKDRQCLILLGTYAFIF